MIFERKLIQTSQALLVAGLVFGSSLSAEAQDAAADFKQNCTSCHTIGGGRLTGPDLKGVLERKDQEWLLSFISDPAAKINGGDPYAVKLQQEARGAVMPTLPGMTRGRAEALLALIAAESKLEKSQFMGIQISERPFIPADVSQGRAIFMGTTKLKNGGPACVSCHTLGGLGQLSGGHVGPDLTRVFERLQGRKGLATWLSAPATATMQPLFKTKAIESEEVLSLTAFFQDAAQNQQPDASPSSLIFFLMGTLGAMAGLFLMGVLWHDRFKSVRRALVHGHGERS